MRKLLLLPLFLYFSIFNFHSSFINAQIITTVAGGGPENLAGNGGPATSAALFEPYGEATDVLGNIYITDELNNCIRKIDTAGIISIAAGSGIEGYSGDGGAATAARLNQPEGVAVDEYGNIYIADTYNSRIRMVNTKGIITTVAGSGSQAYSGDGGPAILCGMFVPMGIAVDTKGNIYFSDNAWQVIRKVSTTDTITTIAGDGNSGNIGDGGPATKAEFNGVAGISLDDSDNIYIADIYNGLVRKVTAANGIINTVAGGGINRPGDGGPATAAQLSWVTGVFFDTNSRNYYIVDNWEGLIRVVNSSGIINTIAGNDSGVQGYSGDGGPATDAEFYSPNDVVADAHGNVYISDLGFILDFITPGIIRKVNTSGIISTFAGGKSIFSTCGDGGPATAAPVWAWQITTDDTGNIYIADYANYRVRKVNTSGIISTIAGNGIEGYSGNGGPATDAELAGVGGIIMDKSGQFYLTDSTFVRKVNDSGIISNFAGNGIRGYSGDGGPATAAELGELLSYLAIDKNGDILIADYGRNTIRSVDTSGIITTVAGNGINGYTGDGGPATLAEISHPNSVFADALGNIYFAENNQTSLIRKVNASGIISTIAGTGVAGFSADSIPATSAQLGDPSDAITDNKGNVFIADETTCRVRKVDTSGMITTIAGIEADDFDYWFGYSGDGGPAIDAELYYPATLAFDHLGNLYINDFGNKVIRKITEESPTGTEKLHTHLYRNEEVSVYPNPASIALYIIIPQVGKATFELYNELGENVIKNYELQITPLNPQAGTLPPTPEGGQRQSAYQIDVSNLPEGVYLYRVVKEDGGLVGSGKVIIMR